MQKNQAAEERNRLVFINVTVVVIFVSLMLSFIVYFEQGRPNLKRLTLENLAESFATSVNNAHWQWQREGRPPIVILSTYAPRLDDQKTLVETDKRPVFMASNGWPKAEPTGKGCEQIWNMVLNLPMEIEGFRVIAEYYDGVKLSGNAQDSRCRFRLSTGPYFEFKVASGEVLRVQG
ncbi:hypothetical protein [Paraglaciecola hydrolytica]|uniref:MSHA biogenesis protein MshF n=1 Tax=Paraglaciecola hydrolytica TaxID=1799789 RepID=A0A136A4G2_9ALTE|nr:hypothetical protein [Paraglaciecola hydrolytica]KXI30107.1 hypothetical protein AX660_08910 [Paraglaciecola hydrolytica]